MQNLTKSNKGFSKILARRNFFKNFAVLALLVSSSSKLHAKGSKEQFKYQDKPKNNEACKDCIHFQAKENKCKVVKGDISKDGWCTLYQKPPK